MSEERIYTLTLEQIDSMLDDAKKSVGVARGMLRHHLDKEDSNHICALLAELFWANFSIKRLLEEEVGGEESAEDGQVVISEKMLALLQTLVFSKELASSELTKFSISTKLN